MSLVFFKPLAVRGLPLEALPLPALDSGSTGAPSVKEWGKKTLPKSFYHSCGFRSDRQALIIRRSPVLWFLVWRPVCWEHSEGSRKDVSLWQKTASLPTSRYLSGSPVLPSPIVGVGKVGTMVTYSVSPHMTQSDSIHFLQ